MKFSAVYVTNTGNKRKNNEDSVLVQEIVVNNQSMTSPVTLDVETEQAWFVVADGIGGEESGEDASGEILNFLATAFKRLERMEDFDPMLREGQACLDEVAHERHIRMGTTLAGLFFSPEFSFAFNVGDCRVYKLSGGYLNRITRDHSLLEEATAAGINTDKIPKNIVTSAVISGETNTMQVFIRPVQVKAGDQFLVCSDGLWGVLSAEEMEGAFKNPQPGQALLDAALPKSQDNVSFITVRFQG